MTCSRQLAGQTVVVIGASSGIGLETARHARAVGAEVIITARDPARLHRAGLALGASIAAFDATDFDRLARFFTELTRPIDHVLVTGPAPHDSSSSMFDIEEARRDVEAHLLLPLQVAGSARRVVRRGGSVLFLGCTGRRAGTRRLAVMAALTPALSSLTEVVAVELAPVRANLIVSGFVEAPPPATVVDDAVVGPPHPDDTRAIVPADVAALAVHLMTNSAITGSTYVIDGGQHLDDALPLRPR